MKNEILEVMKENAPLNWTKAQEIAEKFNVKPRAIVASATRNGIEYERKKRVSKSGAPVLRKTDLVPLIEKGLGFMEGDLAGLEKASKDVLQKMVDSLED
jgi:hypothetical protein